MLRLLATHPEGLSASMLCRALKAKTRTLCRDLEILQKAGFNIHKGRRRQALEFVPNPERQEVKIFLRAVYPHLSCPTSS
jgi:hypothetical protein